VSLKIALSKGVLLKPTIELLKKSEFDVSALEEESRRLYLKSGTLSFILARPSDVATYVEYGAADLGIAGKDALMEESREVFELADLGFGWCQFILAGLSKSVENTKKSYDQLGQYRVATKYPSITSMYFSAKGLQAEIIKLRGSIELAPIVGLADQIYDLSSTGKTLKENNLVVLDKSYECSARLIANYVSNKLKAEEIEKFIKRLKI